MHSQSPSLTAFAQAESNSRHGAFIFLLLYTLIGIDIMAKKTPQEQMQALKVWLPWGITFLLLAFFIIAPEQEATQAAAAK
ncbi:hypothetical protein ACOJUR_02250 [Alicyclobacillus tolerans]|uniref:Uncharacterized protein n=1 Tax=Alicyclobacillus tolerans TaxID=90970 RepID=A0ABT9LYX0_9BACL|nr:MULTISPECIES: hypothetical protein [Alicyclobacillus]MDP9729469.1 hypothetical protein [Alicyclobacillus tengchongensis]QRF22388.1 hypothetical protein FY534_00855 [Alicyclobacillus sp. TC]